MVARTRSMSARSSGLTNGLCGGLLIGLSCTGLVWALLSNQVQPPVAEAQQPIIAAYDMVEVPVLALPVAAGTAVKEIAFRRMSYPRHQIPEGALIDTAQINDRVASTALPANMPLFVENFSVRHNGVNSVVSRIPPGMRAMTIRVDATSAVEGWAGSGSVVDVLLIAHEKTSVIAEKVKILSAERIVVPVEGNSTPQVPSTVTLLVDQEQCLAINTATPLGKIAFALRSPEDEDNWVSSQFTAERLKGRGGVAGERTAGITGFFTVTGKDGGKSFALSDGQWVQTEIAPQGFRVMNSPTARVIAREGEKHATKEY